MCGCTCSTTQAGTKAAGPAEAITLSVPQMTCSHCVKSITEAFAERLPGTTVAVDLATKTVRVEAPADVAASILADAGYEATRF